MAYIDKINPAMPEGRIIIRNGVIFLKDTNAVQSETALPDKWSVLLNHIKGHGYSDKEISRMEDAYGMITRFDAYRNFQRYNDLIRHHQNHKSQLMFWLLFDYYDILPCNRKVSPSDYDWLNDNFRTLLDNCMRAGKSIGLRDLTISVEASSTASFLRYVQNQGIADIYSLDDYTIRGYVPYSGCKPANVYRIGLFIGRYAKICKNERLMAVCRLFPKEKVFKTLYPAMDRQERQTFESFVLDRNSDISLRDRAIAVLMLYTGMRAEDVSNLRLNDIDWERRRILFRQNKTESENYLPLRPVIGNTIFDYITTERPDCKAERVFLSERKLRGQYPKASVAEIINRLYQKAGLRQSKTRKGTHLLRHSFADEMINQGHDIAIVSRILGHSDPDTTLGYLSGNVEQLRRCALDVSAFPIMHKLYTNHE